MIVSFIARWHAASRVCPSLPIRLSAVKYARVKVIRNDEGLAVDYEVQGEYPAYGNNDDRVDQIAVGTGRAIHEKLRGQPTYRDAVPHTVGAHDHVECCLRKEDGKYTRRRDARVSRLRPVPIRCTVAIRRGAVAAMASVAKLPYEHSQDGISYTFSIVPKALGSDQPIAYLQSGQGCSTVISPRVATTSTSTSSTAKHSWTRWIIPEKYPQLTIRVSGYAVNFVRLSREQQLDVINRTFHEVV